MPRLSYPSLKHSIIIIIVLLALVVTPGFGQFVKLRDFGDSEGVKPTAALVSDGTFLYGTTIEGGTKNFGVVYKIKPDNTGFTVIHNFDKDTDGSFANGRLLYDGTSLYGMTASGGAFSVGTIYKLNTDGTGFTTLFNFQYLQNGANPLGGLITDGTVLYGTTSQGGPQSFGTVFKINKNGSNHTMLVQFSDPNGNSPQGELVLDGGFLYGLTSRGGSVSRGVAFKVKTDGTAFAKLLDFTGSGTGAHPYGSFHFDGTFLWGMTQEGGSNNRGVLFRILPDGLGYAKFVDFLNDANGGSPKASLVSDGTFLYGTTSEGGSAFGGTVFKIKLDGSGFSTIFDLTGQTESGPEGTLLLIGTTLYGTRAGGGLSSLGAVFKVATDGSTNAQLRSFEFNSLKPTGNLIFDGTFLYGVTNAGGSYNQGTLYKVKPDGTGFERIFSFNRDVTGARPMGSVLLTGGFLYGMTSEGGANNAGIIYKIKTDGTAFEKLLDFDNTNNGSIPTGGFAFDGTALYGMTGGGGANTLGTIFKIDTDGANYIKLHDFDNTNGATPQRDLIVEGGVLYGLTFYGGTDGFGTAFKMNTNGTGFQKIIDFDYNNGAYPFGSLYSDGTFLYGLTSDGGVHAKGNAFKIKKDGTGFVAIIESLDTDTGGHPHGSFISDGTHLYALTTSDGVTGNGTMLKVKPDGTGFAKMVDFNDGIDAGGTLYSDGTFLYGVTENGGFYHEGTLFKRSIARSVTIAAFEPSVGSAGTYVTILGSDFDPVAANNTVTFGGITAKVLSATANKLVVIVPEGATDGQISITSGTTDTSLGSFDVTTDSEMFNGKVQTCDVTFVNSNGTDDITQTFVPGVAGGKLHVEFTNLDVEDELNIYDGPDDTYPLVATLSSGDDSFEFTSTSPGGELTFFYSWQDESSKWEADITCVLSGTPITINTQPVGEQTCTGETATISTTASGPTNITYQWQFSTNGITWTDISNAGAYSNATTSTLSVNTTGSLGAGKYRCRVNGDGALEVRTSVVDLTLDTCTPTGGELVIYNAISPNGDGKNDFLLLENIDLIPDKKDNVVRIYNRWGDEVFSVTNYNNIDKVFNGFNKNGNKLPSGTYYYKISFESGDDLTGYLQLKY